MITIRESDLEELDMPGRKLKWLVHPDSKLSTRFSANTVLIAPGQTVKPAHSHPNEEEAIFVISGFGVAWVEGEVEPIAPGTMVIFPIGHRHMVRNTGKSALKLLCYFAPPVDFSKYQYFESVEFPETP